MPVLCVGQNPAWDRSDPLSGFAAPPPVPMLFRGHCPSACHGQEGGCNLSARSAIQWEDVD